MKRLIVVFFAMMLVSGCATMRNYDDTATGAVAGGLIGGALAGSKGAGVGALLGAGLGVLADSSDRKNEERAKSIAGLVQSKTKGGNDSGAAQSAATAQSNLAFAEQQRRKCEAKYAVYQKNGVRAPHDCEAEFKQALASAEYASEINPPEVLHATMRGGHRYDGVRRGSRHEAYWRYWGTVGPEIYNRQNGWYRR